MQVAVLRGRRGKSSR